MKRSILLLFLVVVAGQALAQMKETRDLPVFNYLIVTQSIEIELVKGAKEKAEITSDEVPLDDILTEVSGGRLKINLDGWNRSWSGSIKVVLTYRELDGAEVGASARISGKDVIEAATFYAEASSSGRMELTINCTDLEVDVSSSGRLTLKGKADTQDINGSSSGYYDGFDLLSKKVKAEVSSSGKVNVAVSEELIAEVNSSGRVTYKGSPAKLVADQNSSGKVIKY